MDMADAQLYQRWMDGDGDAGDELVRRHYSQLHRWLRGRTPSVDDVAQAAWMAASKGGYTGAGSFGGWLRRLASTAARDAARAERRQCHDMLELDDRTSASRRVLRTEVVEALDDLSQRFRQPIESWAEGERVEDIASATEASPWTVRSRIKIATQRLRERLGA